jgi:hypothetical protein
LGVWVAFLNSPHCLVRHPKQTKIFKNYKKIKIINKKSQINQKYFLFFGGRSARQCIRLFKKSDPKPPMLDIPFNRFPKWPMDSSRLI